MQVALDPSIERFVWACTETYGKIKLVLKSMQIADGGDDGGPRERLQYWVESPFPAVLRRLMADPVINSYRPANVRSSPAWRAGPAVLIRPGVDTRAPLGPGHWVVTRTGGPRRCRPHNHGGTDPGRSAHSRCPTTWRGGGAGSGSGSPCDTGGARVPGGRAG